MDYHEVILKPRGSYVITLAGGAQIVIGARRSKIYHDGAIAITAPRSMPIEREELHHHYQQRRARNGFGTHSQGR